MNPLVSVVIPCYNWESFIKRCIDSLINQTYKNIEIIVVDDWSSDNSLKLLIELSKKDDRIHVFSQNNQWAWLARNLWINKSKWDYITFVDCDDALELEAIQEFINCLDSDTDIIISWLKILHWDKIIRRVVPNESNWLWNQLKFTATVFKFYKHSFLVDNGIYFKKYKIHEDLLFAVTAFSATDKIKILSQDNYINYQYSNPKWLTANLKNVILDWRVLNDLLKDLILCINKTKYGEKMIKFLLIKTLIQDVIFFKGTDGLYKIYRDNYNYIENKVWKLSCYWQNWESIKINLIVNIFVLCTKLKMENLLIKFVKAFM